MEVALGERIDVRPSKIVAGLEAEKTNCWLQKLHIAATTCVDRSNEAVAKVLDVQSRYPASTDHGRLHVAVNQTPPRPIILGLDSQAVVGTALSGEELFRIEGLPSILSPYSYKGPTVVSCRLLATITAQDLQEQIAEALHCDALTIELLEKERYMDSNDVIQDVSLVVVKQSIGEPSERALMEKQERELQQRRAILRTRGWSEKKRRATLKGGEGCWRRVKRRDRRQR